MKNFEKYEKEIREEVQKTKSAYAVISRLSGRYMNYSDEIVNWLYEDYKEPLLTDAEKEYLSNVIEPFRKYVEGIYLCVGGWEPHIGIGFSQNSSYWVANLPNNEFKFANLEPLKKYTLEELGL